MHSATPAAAVSSGPFKQNQLCDRGQKEGALRVCCVHEAALCPLHHTGSLQTPGWKGQGLATEFCLDAGLLLWRAEGCCSHLPCARVIPL